MVKTKLNGEKIEIRKNTSWYYFNKVVDDMRLGESLTLRDFAVKMSDLADKDDNHVLTDNHSLYSMISRLNAMFGKVLNRRDKNYIKTRKPRKDSSAVKVSKKNNQLNLSFDKKENKKVQVSASSLTGPIKIIFNSFEEFKEFLNS